MYKRPSRIEPGTWNICCQRTGFRVPSSEIRMEWDGLLVWKRVWEVRQPQDYLRGIPDNESVPFGNPMQPPVFINRTISPGDL